MRSLISYLCNNLIDPAKKDMFVIDGAMWVHHLHCSLLIRFLKLLLLSRRPGVLVLINDADWELEGGDEYEVKDNDNIFFVSTLHGG